MSTGSAGAPSGEQSPRQREIVRKPSKVGPAALAFVAAAAVWGVVTAFGPASQTRPAPENRSRQTLQDGDRDASLGSVMSAARDILIIVGILLFSGGWFYAYYFFEHFNVSSNLIDVPVHSYYFYSLSLLSFRLFDVVPVYWVILIGALLLVSIAVVERRIFIWLAGGSAVLWLLAVDDLASRAALADVERVRLGDAPRVFFLFKPGSVYDADVQAAPLRAHTDGITSSASRDRHRYERTSTLRLFSDANKGGRLQILVQTDAYYFAFLQERLPGDKFRNYLPNAAVFRIPTAEVALAVTWTPSRTVTPKATEQGRTMP